MEKKIKGRIVGFFLGRAGFFEASRLTEEGSVKMPGSPARSHLEDDEILVLPSDSTEGQADPKYLENSREGMQVTLSPAPDYEVTVLYPRSLVERAKRDLKKYEEEARDPRNAPPVRKGRAEAKREDDSGQDISR